MKKSNEFEKAKTILKGKPDLASVESALSYLKKIADDPQSEYTLDACRELILHYANTKEIDPLESSNQLLYYVKKYNESSAQLEEAITLMYEVEKNERLADELEKEKAQLIAEIEALQIESAAICKELGL